MSTCVIDHLVVAASSLEAGVSYVYAMLGVQPEGGGEHQRMGTHNRLLKLGDALYLEVIAINPAAAPPTRTRWFDLDRLAADSAPRLVTWVARTDDIETSSARCGEMLGEVEAMSRGTLDWRITIPRDGSLPFEGVMPPLIQWSSSTHPAGALRSTACQLVRLEGRHVHADRIRRALHAIGFNDAFRVSETWPGETACLEATIDTPIGRRTLKSTGE